MLKNKKKKGFTLIELIVVIAILGILAAIAVPRFVGTMNNSKVKTDRASARTIVSAIQVGESEGTYKISGTKIYQSDGTTEIADIVSRLVTDKYLDAVPKPQSVSGSFTATFNGDKLDTVKVGSTVFYPVPTP